LDGGLYTDAKDAAFSTMKCLVDLPFDVLLEVLQRIGKGEETDRKNAARWVANCTNVEDKSF
jgi:hypothetical protein